MTRSHSSMRNDSPEEYDKDVMIKILGLHRAPTQRTKLLPGKEEADGSKCELPGGVGAS